MFVVLLLFSGDMYFDEVDYFIVLVVKEDVLVIIKEKIRILILVIGLCLLLFLFVLWFFVFLIVNFILKLVGENKKI